MDQNTAIKSPSGNKTAQSRPDWLLVRSKLASGLTNDLPIGKNYLQAWNNIFIIFRLQSCSLMQHLQCRHQTLLNKSWTLVETGEKIFCRSLDRVNCLSLQTIRPLSTEKLQFSNNFKKSDEVMQ